MGRRKKDYTGLVFGKLAVVGLHHELSKIHKRKFWLLICECGVMISKSSSDIGKLVDNSSCGCSVRRSRNKYTHYTVSRPNKKSISSYTSWQAMKQRCINPNHSNFEYYGGRGIVVCDEWLEFWGFYADMGERPEGLTLDRINVNSGYSKDNCRWVSKSVQSYNTRTQKNNISGKTGVFWAARDERWVSKIDFEGSQITLGYFMNKDEAVRVREDAEFFYYGCKKE